jgi:hypothetical protein
MVTTTTALNLLNGQLGVLSYDKDSVVRKLGNFLVAGDDSSEVTAIKLVQGTPLSGQTQNVSVWEEGDLGFVQSGIIRKNNLLSVAVKKADHGQWGGQAFTAFPVPKNDLTYGGFLNVDSARIDGAYPNNDRTTYVSAPVVNFTDEGITQPLDYVLTHIATQFNSQSKLVTRNGSGFRGNKEFVVLGIKVAGGTGVALGTITPTTSVPFDIRNGVTQVMQFGFAGVSTLADLMQKNTDLTATSTIEVLNSKTAGAAAKVDALIVLGVPHTPSPAFDNRMQLQVTPSLELTPTFTNGVVDPTKTIASAKEQVNTGRQWSINWSNRPGLMVHTMQNQPMGDFFLEGKSYINPAKNYTSYSIEFTDTDDALNNEYRGQKKVVVLLPCEVLSSFVPTVTNVATRLAALSTAYPFVTSNDAGTGTASANTVSQLEAVLTAWLEHARTTGLQFTVTGDAIAGGVYLS